MKEALTISGFEFTLMVAGESGLGKSTLIDRWEIYDIVWNCERCDIMEKYVTLWRDMWHSLTRVKLFLNDQVRIIGLIPFFVQPFPDWPIHGPGCSSSFREVICFTFSCCSTSKSGWKEQFRSTRTLWRSRREEWSWGWRWSTRQALETPSTPPTPSRRSSSTSTCSLTGEKFVIEFRNKKHDLIIRYLRDESGLNRKNIVDNRGMFPQML